MTSNNWLSVRILGSGTEGRETNQFNQPRGVCFDSATKEIMITDCNNHRIQVFQYDTLAFVRQIGKGTQGTGPGFMNYSVGMCIDNTTKVYIADTNNHRITVFNRYTGEFIKNIGSQLGNAPGMFSSPYGVAVDNSTGNIFVADYDNHRIQVLDSEGNFIRIVGNGQGSNPGQLLQPIVVCIDEETGYLYVADYSNNRVQIFHKDTGDFVNQIRTDSKQTDAFNGPRGICIAANYLFISDRENHRIQIFDKHKLEFIRHLGQGPGTAIGQFTRPMELCANIEDGTLLIVDGYNHRVQIIEISELQPQKMISRLKACVRQHTESRAKLLPTSSKIAVCTNIESLILRKQGDEYIVTSNQLGCLYDIKVSEDITNDHRFSSYFLVENMGELVRQDNEQLENSNIQHLQSNMIMNLLKETALSNDYSPYDFAPLIITLEELLKRGWLPIGIDTEIIDILICLLMEINSVNALPDQRLSLSQAIISFIRSVVSANVSLTFYVFRSLSAGLRDTVDHTSYFGDLNECWDVITSFLVEIVKLFLPPIKSTQIIESNKESLVIHREILKVVYGSDILNHLLANQRSSGNEHLKNSATRSPTATVQRASSSFHGRSENAERFRSTYCELLKMLEVFVLFELASDENCKKFVSNDANELQDKLEPNSLKQHFLELAIKCFQTNNESTSIQRQNRPLFRGNRRIWQENEPFQVGDLIDCMDKEKSWFESYITDMAPDGGVEVHFMGWGSKWDDIVTQDELTVRIAPLNTKTKNWRAELFEGGLIEIKCNEDTVHQKWMWGKVLALNSDEEWVDVAYAFGSEATINKRIYLYGENICPIGMHTKEKSKAAAATVIKPAKKIEESIKAKNQSTYADNCFLDVEDDYKENNNSTTLNIYSPSLLESCLSSIKSEGLNDSASQAIESVCVKQGLEVIAVIIFQTTVKIIIDAMDALAETLSFKSPNEQSLKQYNDIIMLAREFIGVIIESPYRHLIARFVLRPYLYRCGIRTKLMSEKILPLHSSISSSIQLSDVTNLINWTESFYNNCESVLNLILEDFLDISILKKLHLKLHTTIFKCSLQELVESGVPSSPVQLKHYIDKGSRYIDLERIIRQLFSSDISSLEAMNIRRFLSYLQHTASYEKMIIIQSIWCSAMTAAIVSMCTGIRARSISSPNKVLKQESSEWGSILSNLISSLKDFRQITKLEFQNSSTSYFITGRAFMNAYDSLPIYERLELYNSLAYRIDALLKLNPESQSAMYDTTDDSTLPKERLGKLADLYDLYKIFFREKSHDKFNSLYVSLLADRLISQTYVSIELEQRAITMFSVGSKSQALINDFFSINPSDQFQRFYIEKIDSNCMGNDSEENVRGRSVSESIIVNSNLCIRNLSAALWPNVSRYCLQYSDLKLPLELKIIRDEYVIYHKERFDKSFNTKTKLNWCNGYGTVQLKCNTRHRRDVLLDCNELQATILMLFTDDAKFSVSQLSELSGLNPTEVINVVSSLSSSRLPVLMTTNRSVGNNFANGNENSLVSISPDWKLGNIGDLVDDELIASKSRIHLIIKAPRIISETKHECNSSELISNWLSSIVDAAIIRILKHASQTKFLPSEVDPMPPTSPYLTLDKLFILVTQDIKRSNRKSHIEEITMIGMIRSRCKYLVSVNVIDCIALKRSQDDSGGNITIPNESNYLYSYISTTSSIRDTNNSHEYQNMLGLSIFSSINDITSNETEQPRARTNSLNRLLQSLSIQSNSPGSLSARKPRAMSEGSATNECKDNDSIGERSSEQQQGFHSLNSSPKEIEKNSDPSNPILAYPINQEQFLNSFFSWIVKQVASGQQINERMLIFNGITSESFCIANKSDLSSEIDVFVSGLMRKMSLSSYIQSLKYSCAVLYDNDIALEKNALDTLIVTLESYLEFEQEIFDDVKDLFYCLNSIARRRLQDFYNINFYKENKDSIAWDENVSVSLKIVTKCIEELIPCGEAVQYLVSAICEPSSASINTNIVVGENNSSVDLETESFLQESLKSIDDEEHKDSMNTSHTSETTNSMVHGQSQCIAESMGSRECINENVCLSFRKFIKILVWCFLNKSEVVERNRSDSVTSLPDNDSFSGSISQPFQTIDSQIMFGRVSPQSPLQMGIASKSERSDRKKKKSGKSGHTSRGQTPPLNLSQSPLPASSYPPLPVSQSKGPISIGVPTTGGKRIQIESPTSGFSNSLFFDSMSSPSSAQSSPSSIHLNQSPSFNALSAISEKGTKLSRSSSNQPFTFQFNSDFKLTLPPSLISLTGESSYQLSKRMSSSPSPETSLNILKSTRSLDQSNKFVDQLILFQKTILRNVESNQSQMNDNSIESMPELDFQYILSIVDKFAMLAVKSNEKSYIQMKDQLQSCEIPWLKDWDFSLSSFLKMTFTLLDGNNDGFIDGGVSSRSENTPLNSNHYLSPFEGKSYASLNQNVAEIGNSTASDQKYNYCELSDLITNHLKNEFIQRSDIELLSSLKACLEVCINGNLNPLLLFSLLPLCHWNVHLVLDKVCDISSRNDKSFHCEVLKNLCMPPTSETIENLCEKYRCHVKSYQHGGQFSNSHAEIEYICVDSFNNCSLCGNSCHYPLSCSLALVHRSELSNRQDNLGKSRNASCFSYKYVEYSNYLNLTKSSLEYYKGLIISSISATDTSLVCHSNSRAPSALSTYSRVPSSFDNDGFCEDYDIIQTQIYNWKVLINSFSLLSHSEILRKHIKLSSETVNQLLEVLEERSIDTLETLKTVWIKCSKEYFYDPSILQKVNGLAIVMRCVVAAFTRLSERGLEDFQFRLSDNLFGKKIEQQSRMRNLVNDSLLGACGCDDISIPLSWLSWKTIDQDFKYFDKVLMVFTNDTIYNKKTGESIHHPNASDSSHEYCGNSSRNVLRVNATSPYSHPYQGNKELSDWSFSIGDRNSIYLMQQRLYLIGKSLNLATNFPICLTNAFFDQIIFVLKYFIAMLHYQDKNISSMNESNEFTNLSIMEDRFLTIMLDMNMYKSLVSLMMIMDKRAEDEFGLYHDIDMYCLLTLFIAVKVVRGLGKLLNSISEFWECISNKLRQSTPDSDLSNMSVKLVIGILDDLHYLSRPTIFSGKDDGVAIWSATEEQREIVTCNIFMFLTKRAEHAKDSNDLSHVSNDIHFQTNDIIIKLFDIQHKRFGNMDWVSLPIAEALKRYLKTGLSAARFLNAKPSWVAPWLDSLNLWFKKAKIEDMTYDKEVDTRGHFALDALYGIVTILDSILSSGVMQLELRMSVLSVLEIYLESIIFVEVDSNTSLLVPAIEDKIKTFINGCQDGSASTWTLEGSSAFTLYAVCAFLRQLTKLIYSPAEQDESDKRLAFILRDVLNYKLWEGLEASLECLHPDVERNETYTRKIIRGLKDIVNES